MTLDTFGIVYAVVVAAGGTFGYVKSGGAVFFVLLTPGPWSSSISSVPSLAAGVLFGSAIGIGAYQFSKSPENYHIALGTSSVLAGLMGSRFYSSGKFMPAGLIAILSVGMAARYASKGLFLTKEVRS